MHIGHVRSFFLLRDVESLSWIGNINSYVLILQSLDAKKAKVSVFTDFLHNHGLAHFTHVQTRLDYIGVCGIVSMKKRINSI